MAATPLQKSLILLLRLSLGWVFLYAGARQLLDPGWTAASFLAGAKTLPGLYAWFAAPAVLPVVDILVKWGHLLIGLSLVAGLMVRLSSSFGALLMMLYYVPRLDFPMVGPTNFIVEYHLVYAMVLVYLGSVHAGHVFGLEGWLERQRPVGRLLRDHPGLRPLFN